ncbi:MAG: ATP-binding cassette domain-containing protein [Magnetococcales bacterium]|nr:ATP-binding cassette domain-containing protein [Magnetococcales bacterium]
MLTVSELSMRFGGIQALKDVHFSVPEQSITALIGPNGAGKTTVFNCVTGFYRATSGTIRLAATEGGHYDLIKILGTPFQSSDLLNPTAFAHRLYYKLFGGSHQVTRRGVARTFQNVRLFREMTVVENLLVAQHQQLNRNVLAGLFNAKSYLTSEKRALEKARRWLNAFDLLDDANRLAGELPYGHQRRLEIARAMCTDPRIICLDEPAAGLNPNETDELNGLIRMLRDQHGVTVLLIEHDMSLVMDISDHVVVLDHGEVIASGDPWEIQNNPTVLEAYLGVEEESGETE